MALPTVAIAGATGNVGAKIAAVFLRPALRPRFRDVVLLTRSATSVGAQVVANGGATLRVYDEENLAAVLEDVDVVVNAIGPNGHSFKEQLLRSLPQTNVKLYFPSEFGVNHYIHDFDHEEWDAKKHHYKLATELIPNIKICRIYAGLFLEDSIGPWFGFNTREKRYEAVGSPTQATSYTSIFDVAKALAILSSRSPDSLPNELQLNGDSKSFVQIANVMSEAGGGPIEVSNIDLATYKHQVLSKPSPTPERYLRFLMGEGKIDHTDAGIGNQNSLVDTDPDFGAWESINGLAWEASGTPWASSDWQPTT